MKTRYIVYLIGVLLSFYSCVDDKGTYDYLEKSSVRITFDEYIFDGVIGEETNIEPKLALDEGDDLSNYEFEWQLNGQIVGHEKVLSYVPTEAITYYALFSVIDKATKFRVMQKVQLYVGSPYKTGWAILSKLNNKTMLSHIRDNAGYINYLNIYETVNNEELGANPYKLVEHYSGRLTTPEILVINQDAKGALEVDGNTMAKVLYTTQEFTEGVPDNFVVKDAAYIYYTDALLTTNGQVYIRQLKNPDTAGFHSAPYSSVPVYVNKGMKITQMIQSNFNKTRHMLMYDEKNHRLLCLGSASKNQTGEILEVTGLGLEDQTLVYADIFYPGSFNCKYMLLLKDRNGNHTLKTFKLAYDLGEALVSSVETFNFPSSYLTEKSKFYGSKDNLGKRLFFTGGAANNEIYYYEKSTNRVTLFTTCSSEITDLQLNKGSTALGVGMKNGFVVYSVTETVLNNKEVKILHEVGNIGEVIDVIYRYGSPSNMYL